MARKEQTKEKQTHEEVRQKLTAAKRELKSSAIMNLELEDYQRSVESLETEKCMHLGHWAY